MIWDEDSLWQEADSIKSDSTCVRRKVGAILVSAAGELLSLGMNTERGGLRCDKGECPRGLKTFEEKSSNTPPFDDCVAVHAEEVALSDWLYVSLEDCTLYVTEEPCVDCQAYIGGNWPGLRILVKGKGEFTCEG